MKVTIKTLHNKTGEYHIRSYPKSDAVKLTKEL
jgi:hypothetical protein